MCNLYSISTNLSRHPRALFTSATCRQCRTYPHPRRPVARPRTDPQGIDNLHISQRRAFIKSMGTKSRETIYGGSVRASAERAAEARKAADRLACEAWNKRMLGIQGPAQPSPTLGDALNAGYTYLEVRCLGCDMHQTVALDIVRRSKATPIHELERYMRCKDCSEVRGYPYKRSHLVALRRAKISANDPPTY
jgi:ribosomal protein S27E